MDILNDPKLRPACPERIWPKQLIGIDLGCFGSRIMVVCPSTCPDDPIYETLVRSIGPAVSLGVGGLEWHRFDFRAHGYPLDDDAPAYDADVSWREFEPVPLKYGFYLLAQELDKTVSQHPMAQELAIYDSPEFRNKIESGLVAMLRNMRARKDAVLAHHWGQAFTDNQTMDQICITIPALWKSSFQKVFLNLVAEAFDYNPLTVHEHVTFITESDARAHAMIGPVVRKDGKEEVVLVLDFGGHMMNGSMFWVGPIESGEGGGASNRFFRIGDSFGAHGGQEFLMHYLLEYVDDLVSSKIGRALSARERAGLRVDITRITRELDGYRTYFGLHSSRPLLFTTESGEEVSLEVSGQEFYHFWMCAYRHPLKVAAQQFALLNRFIQDRKVFGSVIISGGSPECGGVCCSLRTRLRHLASEAGLEYSVFWPVCDEPEEGSLTRGATRAVQIVLTAEQFITQGVGIGLQRKRPGAPKWEDEAPMVLYYDIVAKEYRQNKYTRAGPQVEGTQFRLLCDPIYHVRPWDNPYSEQTYREPKPKTKAERIPVDLHRSYVLFDDLPTAQKRDKYECEVSIEGSGNDTFVVVKVKQTGPSKISHITDLRLRLLFQPGPRRAKATMEPVKVDGEEQEMEEAA